MNKIQYTLIMVILLILTVAIIAALQSKTRTWDRTDNRSAQTCAVGEDCCSVAPQSVNEKSPPEYPTNSGLPCIVLFCSKEVNTCGEAQQRLKLLSSVLKGNADVVNIDIEAFPSESRRWRLRIVPTLLILDKKGNEINRIEGVFSRNDLSSLLRKTGIISND